MTTHIEHVVTEVVPESESSSEGGAMDQRWHEQMKVKALLKKDERQRQRISAEAFDD